MNVQIKSFIDKFRKTVEPAEEQSSSHDFVLASSFSVCFITELFSDCDLLNECCLLFDLKEKVCTLLVDQEQRVLDAISPFLCQGMYKGTTDVYLIFPKQANSIHLSEFCFTGEVVDMTPVDRSNHTDSMKITLRFDYSDTDFSLIRD